MYSNGGEESRARRTFLRKPRLFLDSQRSGAACVSCPRRFSLRLGGRKLPDAFRECNSAREPNNVLRCHGARRKSSVSGKAGLHS